MIQLLGAYLRLLISPVDTYKVAYQQRCTRGLLQRNQGLVPVSSCCSSMHVINTFHLT